MDRRRFIALLGLSAVGAGAAGVLPLGARATPIERAASLPTALRVEPEGGPTTLRPWEAHPDATLANYMAVLQALADGVAPRDVAFLPVFLAEDPVELTSGSAYRLMVTTVFSPDIFHDYAAAELRRTIEEARRYPTLRSSRLAWTGADLAEAAVVAFRRTGDPAFLDLFVDYFDDVLHLRDSKLGLRDGRLGRALPAWGDGQSVPGKWIGHVTTVGRICHAATEFALVTLRDSSLASYHAVASRYVGATERALAVFDGDFRRVPGTAASYYRRPTTGRWEPINHAHQVGRVLLDLHALTGERRYRWRATQIAQVFERSVRLDRSGRPFWRYYPFFQPTRDDERAELIWKASCTVPFIHQAAERGRIDGSIIDAAARSFATRIVRDGELNRTIDPVRFTAVQPGDRHASRAQVVGAWLELAPRCPEIFDRIADLLVRHRRDYLSCAWFAGSGMARGYAMCLGQDPPGTGH